MKTIYAASMIGYGDLPGSGGGFITGAGKLLGFLISHAEDTTQTVTFYNATSAPSAGDQILVVKVAPEQSPCYVVFPRNMPLNFSIGLAVTYTNCEVCLWAVSY